MLTWEGYTAAVIGKVLVLRVHIMRWYMRRMQMLAWVIFVFVEELGSVEDVELVKSRGTRSRMRGGECRLPKSLLKFPTLLSIGNMRSAQSRFLLVVSVLRFNFEVLAYVDG
jgi:hypothetical protein